MKLIYACGAYQETNKPDAKEKYPVGHRMLTFVNDSKVNVKRPAIPDEAIQAEGLKPGSCANCLIMCPCTVRESGRKTGRAWFGEDNDCSGDPVLYVTCKVKEHG